MFRALELPIGLTMVHHERRLELFTRSILLIAAVSVLASCGIHRSPQSADIASKQAVILFQEACLSGLPEMISMRLSVRRSLRERLNTEPTIDRRGYVFGGLFDKGAGISFGESEIHEEWYEDGWNCRVSVAAIDPLTTAERVEAYFSKYVHPSIALVPRDADRERVVAAWDVKGARRDMRLEVVFGKSAIGDRDLTVLSLLWRH